MSYRVTVTTERVTTFCVEAECVEDVYDFMDRDPEWLPGDVEGLIDTIEDIETSYSVVEEPKVVGNFRVTAAGDICEVE